MKISKEEFTFSKERELNDKIYTKSISYWQDGKRRLKKNKLSMLALYILLAIGIMCIVGPILVPYEYDQVDLSKINLGPTKEHWFGTDQLGRDIFTRVWIGGRVSLAIGLLGAFIDITIGLLYGGISAYFGGKVDDIMMRITEILSSIPYLVLVILITLIVGKGILGLVISMTLTGWCYMARLVRGQILQIKSQDYILVAEALGTRPLKIIKNHLLPNILGIMIVAVTFDIPSFIFSEAFLSYMGIGIQSPMTSWGALAADAEGLVKFYPYQLFFPALMISLTMLSFQILGDGLRDALDPKLRQ